jgi:hypothetical protein
MMVLPKAKQIAALNHQLQCHVAATRSDAALLCRLAGAWRGIWTRSSERNIPLCWSILWYDMMMIMGRFLEALPGTAGPPRGRPPPAPRGEHAELVVRPASPRHAPHVIPMDGLETGESPHGPYPHGEEGRVQNRPHVDGRSPAVCRRLGRAEWDLEATKKKTFRVPWNEDVFSLVESVFYGHGPVLLQYYL